MIILFCKNLNQYFWISVLSIGNIYCLVTYYEQLFILYVYIRINLDNSFERERMADKKDHSTKTLEIYFFWDNQFFSKNTKFWLTPSTRQINLLKDTHVDKTIIYLMLKISISLLSCGYPRARRCPDTFFLQCRCRRCQQ